MAFTFATLAQLKQDFYDIVGEQSNSTVYPSSDTGGTYVELLANRVQDTILRENKWWFLKTKSLVKTALNTTLNGDVATTDTTIDLTDATGYPSSGGIWVNGDIINYTGVSTNQLTGVTGIGVAHTDSEDVEIMYDFPSNFSHAPRVIVLGVGEKPIRYIQVEELDDHVSSADDHNFDFGGENLRWSKTTDADGNEFIRLKNPTSIKTMIFHYYKVAAEMTSSVDSTMPDPFARKIIPFFMADLGMKERGDNPDGLADDILVEAERELNKMKAYNTKRMQTLRPKVFNMYRSGNARQLRRIIIN